MMPGEYDTANEFGKFQGKLLEWSHVARSSRPGGDGRGWLERRPALAMGLAVLGVVVGFALLIVPGLYAIRSIRRWRQLAITPDLSWNLGLLGIWAGIGAALWVSGILLIALIAPVPGWLFSMSAIRR